MGLRRRRSVIVPLLALLWVSAAAAPTAEEAAQNARTAIDRAQYELAEKTIEEALRRYGSRQDETVWSLRVMRGEVLHGRGKNADVRRVLAGELPAALRTSRPAVRRLLTLGYAAIHLGEGNEATRVLHEARTIAAAHQPSMIPEIYGALAIAAPDAARAEPHARQGITEAKRFGDRRAEARAMAALQWQYGRAGNYAESIEWGQKALSIARSLQLDKMISQLEGNLGWMYRALGDFESAEELFVSAHERAARLGADAARVSFLVQLGNLRVDQRDWAGADRFYRAAAERAKAIGHRDLPFALANLASISIETGRLDDARRFNAEALALKKKAKDAEAELRSWILDARIAAAERQYGRAEKTLRRVIRETKQVTTRWEAQGRLAEVLAMANRADVADKEFRLAIDTTREARQTIRDPELRLSFFNTVADVFGSYIDFLVERGRTEDALAVTEISRAQTLEEGLDMPPPARKLDARAIAKEEGATILCYWLGRRSYVWTITPAAVTVAPLPADNQINAAVEAYRRVLAGPRGTLEFSHARGQELYRMLVERAARGVARGSRLIIVPDGGLHALNFETLVTPSQRYWIEDVVIAHAGSMQLLARAERPRATTPTMLLIGNPPPADPAFPPLRRANEEMQSIARHFAPSRRRVIGGAAATPASYRGASPGRFDFVHFVAHGVATRRRPLDSAVILGRDPSNQYRLAARDIVKQPLRARLVTISSCHGAGSRAYAGEGLVGLAWAFLRAGSSNVIAALWEVNDAATPQLMDRVYAGIQAGRDPAVALREAKLAMLRSNSVYRKPLYWAPFVLYSGT